MTTPTIRTARIEDVPRHKINGFYWDNTVTGDRRIAGILVIDGFDRHELQRLYAAEEALRRRR